MKEKGRIIYSSSTPVQKWSTLGTENVSTKKYGLALVEKQFINPANGKTDLFVFCRKGDGITVVPLLPGGNLVITRQFKQGINKIVWEFPAGINMETSANPKIELKEESGLKANEILFLANIHVAPRKLDTAERIFIALDCEFLSDGPSPSTDEIIEVWEVSPRELWELIETGDGDVSGFSQIAFFLAVAHGFIKQPW